MRTAVMRDLIEKMLYNIVIGSMDRDGKRFFYVNPLEVWPEACEKNPERHHVKPVRQKGFGCACCPPNLARLLSSLGCYVYSVRGGVLYVHQYIGGDASFSLGGEAVRVSQRTNYPWSGEIVFTIGIRNPREFTLALRIPGWCRGFSLSVNGEPEEIVPEKGYIHIRRFWNNGDTVSIELLMPVELAYANPNVRADAGKAAIQRGPWYIASNRRTTAATFPPFRCRTIRTCGLNLIPASSRGSSRSPGKRSWITIRRWAKGSTGFTNRSKPFPI